MGPGLPLVSIHPALHTGRAVNTWVCASPCLPGRLGSRVVALGGKCRGTDLPPRSCCVAWGWARRSLWDGHGALQGARPDQAWRWGVT